MSIVALLILMGINAATSRIHSLKYFHTASSQVPNVPEFVSVGLVDDVQIVHYESKTSRALPKQDWMNLTTDPRYWQRETMTALQHQQDYKGMINLIKQIFNHDGGGHVLQVMSGCEWNNETGEIRGYEQYGYDGEDFVRYDLETETWIAQVPQAGIIKQKWDADTVGPRPKTHHLTKHYPDLLKEFLYYGRSSLLRTVLPSVSLLQKSPSSPISCHATGFYPNSSILFWRKDGKELHEGVDQGEILPNHDGTFQRRSDLQVPSVPPEAWGMYECVFQLAGVEDEIITKLNKAVILTNREKDNIWIVITVGPVVILTLIPLIVTGYVFYIKRKANRPPTQFSDQPNDQSVELSDLTAPIDEQQNHNHPGELSHMERMKSIRYSIYAAKKRKIRRRVTSDASGDSGVSEKLIKTIPAYESKELVIDGIRVVSLILDTKKKS